MQGIKDCTKCDPVPEYLSPIVTRHEHIIASPCFSAGRPPRPRVTGFVRSAHKRAALLSYPSREAARDDGESSDEDSSDEAFLVRHLPYEKSERNHSLNVYPGDSVSGPSCPSHRGDDSLSLSGFLSPEYGRAATGVDAEHSPFVSDEGKVAPTARLLDDLIGDSNAREAASLLIRATRGIANPEASERMHAEESGHAVECGMQGDSPEAASFLNLSLSTRVRVGLPDGWSDASTGARGA